MTPPQELHRHGRAGRVGRSMARRNISIRALSQCQPTPGLSSFLAVLVAKTGILLGVGKTVGGIISWLRGGLGISESSTPIPGFSLVRQPGQELRQGIWVWQESRHI